MTLTKPETSALKGLSIILIVMHNVVHLTAPFRENEFMFKPDNAAYFFSHFLSDPLTCFFTFFGWIGVPFFVFASGYGLACTYANTHFSTPHWITRHYLKLEILLFPAFLIYFFYCIYRSDGALNYPDFLLEQLLLLNIIDPIKIPIGILWYIGMAFQLYLCFLLFRKLSYTYLILILIATVALLATLPPQQLWYIRHNCVGWFPEFIFGILFARIKHLRLSRFRLIAAALSAITGIIVLSAFRPTYFLSGICFIVLLLAGKKYLAKSRLLIFIGKISASIYIVHAVARSMKHIFIPNFVPPIYAALIVLLVSICISIPYNRLYTIAYTKLKNRFNTPHHPLTP